MMTSSGSQRFAIRVLLPEVDTTRSKTVAREGIDPTGDGQVKTYAGDSLA